ncbi:hypothetical protein E8E12_009123 [Didymella heteroderae]|uniref:Peptidase A1 domain-containing protein n=1 Tax=Didymella heteroderae TaxID=1769908 RepID=A0A9P4WTQ7_9PLEO|nr:hypothetical protein E8E12_009123 [Didymella heteroderae]
MASSRGQLFNVTDSKSWYERGFWALWVGRDNFGLSGNGHYGYDTVALGIPGEEGPSVDNTTIGTLKNPNFWLGHLGLHPKPTNWSTDVSVLPPVPSYMTMLYEQGNIPSRSYGFTAGSQYRDATFLSSLTLGGYDASRYISNDLSFVFAPDNERELVVELAGLTANTTIRSNINLLPASTGNITLSIDTTVAELYLPQTICDAFQEAFGLTLDNKTGLYLVDDLLHETLIAQNPRVTFSLRQSRTSDQTVQITLPYGAFDLQAQRPYRGLNDTTRYFPLRAGKDENQWALGRMFLQEAYITVDHERSRFSVYQCDWTYGKPKEIIPIVSPDYAKLSPIAPKADSNSDSHTGVTVGVTRAKEAADAETARKTSPTETDEPPSSPTTEKGPNVFPKAELPGQTNVYRYEMGTDEKEKGSVEVLEVDNTERPVYEMMGDIPTPQEAASRQLSEKESMMVREKNINGVDPHAATETTTLPRARPAPLASLDEIAMVNTRLPTAGVSPVTPRAPRDGAHLEASDTFYHLPAYRAQQDGRSLEDLRSPISPLDAPSSTDNSRRRFSYES